MRAEPCMKNESVYFMETCKVVYWTNQGTFPADMILYKLEVSLMIHSEIMGADTQPLPSLISKKWDSEAAQQSDKARKASDSTQPTPPVALNCTACFACELCICIVIQMPILIDGSCCWECLRQHRGSHQGSKYKWQKSAWKQQSRHCLGLRQCVWVKWVGEKGLGGDRLDERVDLYLCAAMSASQVHDSWGILMCNLEWHPSQKCFHVVLAFDDGMQYQLDVTLEGIWPYGCQFSCTSKKGLSVL